MCMSDKCPICGNPVPEFQPVHDKVECKICGTYFPEESFLRDLYKADLFQKPDPKITYLISGVVREQTETIAVPKLQSLDELKAKIPFENDPLASIDRILMYIYQKSDSAAAYFVVDPSRDYPIAYAKNEEEFVFFVDKAKDLGYLEVAPNTLHYYRRLSLKGWERVSHLRLEQSDSRQAFVAMWFNDEMTQTFLEGFKPALEATGYKAFRIDMSEHNGKIDDRIIAEIRKSGLLVADFTGQRGGVYFEAGFAMGLGIPVIWTCRNDIDKLHFDTRQYNHIVWSETADLREKLQLRIEASLPNRPK